MGLKLDQAKRFKDLERENDRLKRIREMLVAEGWRVNVKRVYRIWRVVAAKSLSFTEFLRQPADGR